MYIWRKILGLTPNGRPRGPRKDPKLVKESCQSRSQNKHKRYVSMSRRWWDFCQKSCLCHGQVSDSNISENHAGEAPRHLLVAQQKSEIWNSSLTLFKGQLK